ncbi:MAG: FecR domain-containing protein [Bacteroidales bacterium]|nr:FecR domain-containing protein [Bacteroidales bacterium]
MNNNDKHINIDLITRYLANELSLQEKSSAESWIDASDDNRKQFDQLKKVWDTTGTTQPDRSINIDKEWKYLQHKIGRQQTLHRQSGLRVFVRIAAAVIIALGILFIVKDKLIEKTVKTRFAETKEVVLPDGSKVTLNANSKISYKKNFILEERLISLKGEAFFEVEKNPDIPFVISVNEAEIKVLGTSFNVRAYKSMDNIEVTVKEGLVSLYEKKQEQKKVLASAGEKAEYNRNLKVVKKQLNQNKNYNAWKTRIMIFENDSLSGIVNTIGQVYHKNITIKNPELNSCTLTTTFENKDLNTVLEVLESTLDIVVEQDEDNIIISGEGC